MSALEIAALVAFAIAASIAVHFWRRVQRLERSLQFKPLTGEHEEIKEPTSAEAWLRLPVEGTQDALWDWDITADRVQFSARWREMLGQRAQEVVTSIDEWMSRVHPADRAQVQADTAAQTASASERFQSEHRLRHESGQWITVQWSGVIVRDGAGRALRVAGSVRDITSQRAIEEQARREAFYDGLTGLPNRALANDLLRRAIIRTRRQGERRFAALLVDLDRFIRLNDALGSSVGDELIRAVARRLGTAIRPGDVMARLGHDVFLLILDNVSEASEAERVADRVRLVLQEPVRVLTHEVTVSASIGIALHEPQTLSPEDYVRNAELAMEVAKAAGGARYALFSPDMRDNVRHRASLEHDLRAAIARGEMMVWYQPIFAARDDKTILRGFEALCRWAHPERGVIAPSEFIPLAEETGMIVPLGSWVIGEACRHMMALAPNGPHAPWVSVNVAARQLVDGALIDIVERALETSGLEARRLRLEVTENVILEDEETARTTLQALRSRGIMILMDDFGTGHASLSYLHRLPIGSIKIDRYFVGRMDVSQECREIVRSVVSLAKTLSMDVVAEGVEQQEQLLQLQAMGCEHVQGFLFSQPLHADDTHAFLGERERERLLAVS